MATTGGLKVPDLRNCGDQMFDPWCIPITDGPRAIIEQAIIDVLDLEQRQRLRRRARGADDQAIFRKTITAVLSDMMRANPEGDMGMVGAIYVPRSKKVLGRRSRYRPPILGETFPVLLDRLQASGWLIQSLGDHLEGTRTTITPGARLLAAIAASPITSGDFATSCDAETIILKRDKQHFWDRGGLIDYKDTDTTVRYRRQMADINAAVAAADIRCEGQPIDRRWVYRSFTRGRFDSGGRLFGGAWQNMPKDVRRKNLHIGSQRAVELDYDQMHPRILYALCGLSVPSCRDLYDVPSLPASRGTIKKVTNAMLFATSPFERKPRDTAQGLRGLDIGTVVSAICEAHDPVRHLFFTDIGHRLQFIESQIMVSVLLDLIGKGIVALPVHDAIMVEQGNATVAKEAMLAAFEQQTGQMGSVSRA